MRSTQSAWHVPPTHRESPGVGFVPDNLPVDTYAAEMTERTVTAADLAARLDPFTAVVDAVPTTAWGQQTPCDQWLARDVIGHLIETQRDFLLRHEVAVGAEAASDADPRARWHTHAEHVSSALTAEELSREVDGYFGPTTIGETMIDFYGFDLIVHRWDLAQAIGQGTQFSEDEMAAVDRSIATFGDQMYHTGICAPAIAVAAESDRQTKLLALMGRSVGPVS